MISEHIKQLRQQFSDEGIAESSVDQDPFEQFKVWFAQAEESGIAEPNGFSLCTVSLEGTPSQRTVLMKHFDGEGFVFFTNHQSRKGRQLKDNPVCSMLFPWYELHRQINVEGIVTQISDETSEQYFQSRPRGSQIGAWASQQSEVLESRKILEQRILEVEDQFIDQAVPLPPFWGGYRVQPHRFEFWQGRSHRLHDRIVYTRTDSGWDIVRLYP